MLQMPDATKVWLLKSMCLKVTDHFGYTTYVDTCTGIVRRMQWDAFDWASHIAVVPLVIAFGAAIAYGLWQSVALLRRTRLRSDQTVRR